jgi:carbamoyltransferase
MESVIIGVSAFYHDSAAALIINGEIIAAAQEERFTRKKHDASFPENAVRYVLEEGGIKMEDITAVAFYDKPLLKFERLLETYHAFAPRGLVNFITAVPVWIKDKLYIRKSLQKKFVHSDGKKIPLLFPEHHLSHAASAFYPSPFEDAAILTIDGAGEWVTASICEGNANQIKVCKELLFPHSVGLLYSAFTYYLGFSVNGGEYKLMGLAPYGNAAAPQTYAFREKIMSEMVDIREDGSIVLNMNYFDFATRLRMTNDKSVAALLGIPRRKPESAIGQEHMNLAMAVQEITASIVVALARTTRSLTRSRNLVMAGGVALNCTANSQIADARLFDNIWIQPAAGDAGGSIGAALAAFHLSAKCERKFTPGGDKMGGAYLGPQFNDKQILRCVRKYQPCFQKFENFDELLVIVAKKIAEGNVIGWFQDRMEFGPRALGNRSILGDPRNPRMQEIMNVKIKFREGFRPFAPAVLLEDADQYFTGGKLSPYMLFVSQLKEAYRIKSSANNFALTIRERLNEPRSCFPAVTHVDFSARVQTVAKEINPKFWGLINEFKKLTGHGMLINTSFNMRGEPIVCNPEDAFLGFMRTGMDYLVTGNYLFDKKQQPELPDAFVKKGKTILD